MLQLLGHTKDNIIATRADGLLTAAGYAKILPLVHNIVRTGKKVRWYFEADGTEENFLLNNVKQEVANFNTGFPKMEAIDKIALVSPDKWMLFLQAVMKRFTAATVKCFNLQERTEAMAWLSSDNLGGNVEIESDSINP